MSRSHVTAPQSSGKDWTDYVAALWLYGLVFGTPLMLAFGGHVPDFLGKVFMVGIVFPFLALMAFGIVGAVLGSLGCK